MKTNRFAPISVVAIPFAWILISAGAGLGISSISPHGMAAFAFSGVILGIFGATCHIFLYTLNRAKEGPPIGPAKAAWLGAGCGFLSFPISTIMAERGAVYFPHDAYQACLLVFLIILGISAAYAATRISEKLT